MRLDLHLHSTASDGDCTPAEVVRRALEVRLDAIALSDHDTVAGVAEAREAAAGSPIEVIPAVEVSSTHDGRDLHVLGYFVDLDSPVLAAHAAHAYQKRADRMREMLSLLEEIGIRVTFQEVVAAAGDELQTLARPHLARAMQRAGHVKTVPEAFNRYIGDDGPAFVPTRVQEPEQAVELIRAAGGLAVWAHPRPDRVDPLLPGLVEAGLGGLEVFRPYHGPEYMRELQSHARRHGLVVTGGSDWHGPDRGKVLGDFFVTAEEVGAFLDRGGI